MEIKTLEKLFIGHLKNIYNGEKQLAEALPKIAKAVLSKDLKVVLKEHQEQTRTHIERLHKIFQALAVTKVSNDNCDVVEGLLDEAEDLMEEYSTSELLDTELIALCQKIEHFEIASYNSVINFAKMLGYDTALELLQQTLDEEYEADNKLYKLTEDIISIYIKE